MIKINKAIEKDNLPSISVEVEITAITSDASEALHNLRSCEITLSSVSQDTDIFGSGAECSIKTFVQQFL